jgi:oligoribonuclease
MYTFKRTGPNILFNLFQSGLTQACRESVISTEEAERLVLKYLAELTPPGKCPIAGNTVHMDRMFLTKLMPALTEHCHYRIVDVSSIKELCR